MSGRGEPASDATGTDQAAADRGEDSRRRFPVVGIGASAGGIEALEKLFRALPTDGGLAFVVVQHLHPEHESHMSELLRRYTKMPVVAVEEGVRVQPDHVYMILPNRELTIRDGVLHLAEMTEARETRRPVDGFLTSLAEDQEERAIGVILSGTGSNGTTGIRAIKAAGGLTIAQTPETAGHPGMPRSAIGSGMVDLVLAPEDMPETLQRYARHLRVEPVPMAAEPEDDLQRAIDRLLVYLLTRTGHDFRSYKKSTVLRRINRRMGLCGAHQISDYENLLRQDDNETRTLVKDLMINVTEFFRDSEAWGALERQVIAPLVREREQGTPIRIWVPACATGEEAYSIAILLAEQAEAAGKTFDVKIFATDPGDRNLEMARHGVFPATIEQDLSDERLRRFFQRADDTYRVSQQLRDMVIFAPHNVLQDPPFFRVDLLSCRNFLIYLEDDAQQRVLRLFHFALCEGGYLFLGTAETIGRHADLFDPVSQKWRIYQRVGPTRHDLVDFPVGPRHEEPPARVRQESADAPPAHRVEAALRALAERYAPASVLIDRAHRVLYFHGETGRFLSQPSGEPTRDLFALAREGLRSRLRAAVYEAGRENRETSFTARIRASDTVQKVHGTVQPLKGARSEGLVVSFELADEETRASAVEEASRTEAQEDSGVEREYETELAGVRQELSQTIEELETSNEELKASNEEITSMNEELQSANEELETSKEELQSLNEELNTVNNQLQRKVEELEGTTNDLNNLLTSSDVATVFLDRKLRIRWFSPAIEELIDILPSDIGRPITHFAIKFDDPNLCSDAETVLDKLMPAESEVHTDDRFYLRRIVPYRTRDDRIDGVVITFVDITSQKKAEETLRAAHEQLQAIFDAVREPLLVLGPNLRVRSANASFYDVFPWEPAETEGRLIFELGDGQWDIAELRRELSEVLPETKGFDEFEVEQEFVGLGRRTLLLNGRQIDQLQMILLSIEDITERRRWEEQQQLLLAELSHRVKNTLATVQAIAAQTARSTDSMEEFRQAFNNRLEALGAVHSLLTGNNWQSASLHQVLNVPLEAYQTDDHDRVGIRGEDFTLTARAALTLGIVINELTTNAAKYGALSQPGGRIDIATGWGSSDLGQAVSVTWTESGGPRIEPSSDRGFGLTLVERSIAHELDGEARVEFRPDGLFCELLIPHNPDNVQAA